MQIAFYDFLQVLAFLIALEHETECLIDLKEYHNVLFWYVFFNIFLFLVQIMMNIAKSRLYSVDNCVKYELVGLLFGVLGLA